MHLAVVTSCHNYGRYLAEWAASIVAQTTRPAMVVVVDNGSTDDSPEQIREAAAVLEAAGLRVLTERIDLCNFGRARNAAVALADTEWVMHLDADDVLMPHALADVAELAESADVVSLGYERFGDLAAGPKNRTRIYRDLSAAEALASPVPASGVSPFRRSFWERRPYAEDMQGGWDTALWLGFAHLGARFRATKRPVFLYRQHADSIFNTRRVDRHASAVVGAQLQALRRGDEGRVSILVPRRGDGGPRDAAWAWLRRRYAELYPAWEIVEGTCPGEAWRKGVAVNDAARRASGDVFVVADCDCALPRAALTEAVAKLRPGCWVIPHRLVHRLAEAPTARILGGAPGTEGFGGPTVREPYEGFAGGGVFVVSRAAFFAAGGFPTGFVGWGAEDETMATILNTLVGPWLRLEHDLWHLWHPGLRTKDPHFEANKVLHRVYRAARGNKEAMRMIVSEQGTPLDPGSVRMVAIRTHMRGRLLKRGDLFICDERTARQYEARQRNPLAARVPAPPDLAEDEGRAPEPDEVEPDEVEPPADIPPGIETAPAPATDQVLAGEAPAPATEAPAAAPPATPDPRRPRAPAGKAKGGRKAKARE